MTRKRVTVSVGVNGDGRASKSVRCAGRARRACRTVPFHTVALGSAESKGTACWDILSDWINAREAQ